MCEPLDLLVRGAEKPAHYPVVAQGDYRWPSTWEPLDLLVLGAKKPSCYSVAAQGDYGTKLHQSRHLDASYQPAARPDLRARPDLSAGDLSNSSPCLSPGNSEPTAQSDSHPTISCL